MPRDNDRLPCFDKSDFSTYAEANAAILNDKWKHDTKKLKVYKCRHCQLYHIASDYE